METEVSPEVWSRKLVEDGFCVILNMADEALVNKTRAGVGIALAAYDAARRHQFQPNRRRELITRRPFALGRV